MILIEKYLYFKHLHCLLTILMRMNKVISSVFMLLLLLLILWSLGAWIFGTKAELNAKAFFVNVNQSSDPIFNYEILKYDKSIFGAKAKIKLDLNLQNTIAQFIQDSFSGKHNQIINIDIYHGPILFDRSGVHFGSSAWKLSFDKNLDEEETLTSSNILKLHQLRSAILKVGFKGEIEYKIPLKIHLNEVLVKGSYDLNTDMHKGNLSSDQLNFQSDKQKIQTTAFNLLYQQIATASSGKSQIEISAEIPELVYTHSSLADKVTLKVDYQGSYTIENNVLDNDNRFNLDMVKKGADSYYPIDKGDLRLNLSALNLNDLLQINSTWSQIKSLQKQSQWLLEEQGELPEGQDQIWQVEDRAAQYSKQIPKLLTTLILKDGNKLVNHESKISTIEDKSRINFSFSNIFKNKESTIQGAVFPEVFDNNEDISQYSLTSLLQVQSKVNLDKQLLDIISTLLPIKKQNFKLIYKQNKLLMQ